MPRNHRPPHPIWSNAAEIVAKRMGGAGTHLLAEQYGVTPATIRKLLRLNGHPPARKALERARQMTVPECAYVAGIIDGEGSVCACVMEGDTRPRINTSLQIVTTSPDLAGYIAATTGVGSVGQIVKKDAAGHQVGRTLYRWIAGSMNAHAVLRQVSPYLVIKKQQAEWFMELSEIKTHSYGHHRHNPRRQLELCLLLYQSSIKGRRSTRMHQVAEMLANA